MRCTNCGAEFEGNICPNCQKPVSGWTDDVLTPDGQKQDSEEKPNEPAFDFSFSQLTQKIKNKKSKEDRGKIARIIAEIVGGVLVVTFLITTVVSKSEYGKLVEKYRNLAMANSNNETEIADLTKVKNEYGEYKERMKPYEALDEAEAKERQIQADKVAADKKAADDKAAADKKAADDKAAAEAEAQKQAAAKVTTQQRNALSKARDYLGYSAFSYTGLIEQLEYEGFPKEDATYAADNCGADWNAQAAAKAKDYMNYSSFSRDGLIEQLQYEGFTPDQAAFGATSVGY